MNFYKPQDDTLGIVSPNFELPNGNYLLSDDRSIKNYNLYREEYKVTYGVMPELDKINNPICAIDTTSVFLPEDFKKDQAQSIGKKAKNYLKNGWDIGSELMRGDFGGVMNGVLGSLSSTHSTEHIREFISLYSKIIPEYQFAYSLLRTYDLSFIKDLPVGNYYSKENLGYSKSSNGTYYEGTWQDGILTYGLMYPGDASYVYVGKFDKYRNPVDGVLFDGVFNIGTLKKLELNCDQGIKIFNEFTMGDMSFDYKVEVGGFKDGYKNGTVIIYLKLSDGRVDISKTDFVDGEEVKSGFFGKKKKPGLLSKFLD